MLVRAKIQKVNTRFHAGIDVRPVTPCIFSWYVYRCSCRRDQKKIEVIPAWIHKLPRLQQMRKLQDLENSMSCRRATFGKFHILPARFGKFKTLLARLGKFQILPARFGKFQTLPARFGKFRSCRQDFENLDLAARFGKFKILQLTRVKSPLLTYHLVKLQEK